MIRSFNYSFEDESDKNTLTFECSEDEHFRVVIEDGVAVLYAAKAAFGTLARIFAKMATSDYQAGFHVHIGVDFEPDKPEILRLIVGNGL